MLSSWSVLSYWPVSPLYLLIEISRAIAIKTVFFSWYWNYHYVILKESTFLLCFGKKIFKSVLNNTDQFLKYLAPSQLKRRRVVEGLNIITTKSLIKPCHFLTGCSKKDRRCSNWQWRQASTESGDRSEWSHGRINTVWSHKRWSCCLENCFITWSFYN